MSSKMQAIILAAGRGIRLRKLGEEVSKCLLQVGGRTLIEYSLDQLAGAGMNETIIVTGHYDHLIHESAGNRHLGMPIRYTYNAAFATTGSVVSLLVGAKSAAATPILVLESDLLYHPGFIEAAMDMPNDTLLVADISGSGDEVYICAGQDDRLEYLGKAVPKHLRARSLGEFSGITRMSPEFTEQYCAASEALLESGKAKGHYEELIFSLSKDGTPFFARHCSGLPWTEIDTEADFIRARDKVFPQLRAAAPAIFGPRTAVKIHSVGG